MALLPKKKPTTVDAILVGFTAGLNQLKALTEANRNVAKAKRDQAETLDIEADALDFEANRAVTVVENIERLLAVPVPTTTA